MNENAKFSNDEGMWIGLVKYKYQRKNYLKELLKKINDTSDYADAEQLQTIKNELTGEEINYLKLRKICKKMKISYKKIPNILNN